MVRGGSEFKLVTGVIAMNEGDANGLDDEGENVEDVDTEGEEERDEVFVFVDDNVAGLIMSVLLIEGDNFEGEIVVAIEGLLEAADSCDLEIAALSLEDFELSCLD